MGPGFRGSERAPVLDTSCRPLVIRKNNYRTWWSMVLSLKVSFLLSASSLAAVCKTLRRYVSQIGSERFFISEPSNCRLVFRSRSAAFQHFRQQ